MKNWHEEFVRIYRTHGVSRQKDRNLLMEAYRRKMMFHPNEPIETSWVGLGTPSEYRTAATLFTTIDGKQMARVNHWWRLTEAGLEVMLDIITQLPFPATPEERVNLNDILYGRT